ncbi:MAG: oligosaccharide flippase family protein [Chloroflexota bacterium]|nr:oligosaccharide flippase family protein [Chloroflexota bacterium]
MSNTRAIGPGLRAILASSVSLVGTTAVTSGLGYVYWWVAARRLAPAELGFGAAAISAMLLLGTMAMVGLGTLLIRELPREGADGRALLTAALATATFIGVALGLLFALVAPHFSTDLGELAESPASIGLFAVGVALTATTLVLDQALLGLLRAELQFVRNAMFALAKLGALVFFIVGGWLVSGWQALYVAWLVGGLASLGGLTWLAWARGQSLLPARPRWAQLRALGGPAVAHHALNVALQAAQLGLPVLVTVLLSPTTNAYFYTAWIMASLVFVVPVALTTSLYAVGSHDARELAAKVRFTLKLALLAAAIGNLVLLFGAGALLELLFGRAYADEAGSSLRIIALGAFPLIVKDHYVAIRRMSGQLVRPVLLLVAAAGLELVLAGVGARVGGLSGLSLGWLAALSLEIVPMARTVYDAATRSDRGPHPLHQRRAATSATSPSLHGSHSQSLVVIEHKSRTHERHAC